MNIDTQIASSYVKHLQTLHVQRARVACLLGFFLFPATLVLEFSMYPDYLSEFLALRLFCSTVLLIVYLFSFSRVGSRHGLFLGMFAILFMAFILNVMIHRLGYETPYYAGLNLVILAIGVLFTWEFYQVLLVSISIYLMYLIPILVFQDIRNYPILLNNNLFIIETIIIASVSNYFSAKLRSRDYESRYRLSDAVKELSQLDQAKTNFFSGISHELRTPLTLILAPTESALKEGDSLDPKNRERYEMIHSNGLRLLKLINNLLDVVRVNTGKLKLNYSQKDLIRLINSVISNLTPLVEKKKIKIEIKSNVPSLPLYMDEENIEKVILNLIQNSVKFTPEAGNIYIESQDLGEEVKISIQDTGIGIPKEYLTKIFDLFVQAETGNKRSFEGSGVGLALSRQIIELHGGKIWAESEPNEGTRITFTLPKKITGEIPSLEQSMKNDWTKEISRKAAYEGDQGIVIKREMATQGKDEDQKQGRVLVVEDNAGLREYLLAELRKYFSVTAASDGKAALSVAQEEKPDVVISDVMMPEMDGYELCQRLKSKEETKLISVILLTAKADLDMRLAGYQFGADDYIVKPFNSEELIAKVKAIIESRKRERELELYRRLAAVGELAAGVAHELNNALGGVLHTIETTEELVSQKNKSVMSDQIFPKILRAQEIAKGGVKRSLKVVEDLLQFSQKNNEGYKFNNIEEGLETTLSLLSYKIQEKEIEVVKNYDPLDKVYCHLGQLNQIFLVILNNAIDFNRKGGKIWIKTKQYPQKVEAWVKDTGIGIAEKDKIHLFNPFFTTRKVGEGKGLGLWIAYNYIKNSGGDIEVLSEKDKGTEVKISFPRTGGQDGREKTSGKDSLSRR